VPDRSIVTRVSKYVVSSLVRTVSTVALIKLGPAVSKGPIVTSRCLTACTPPGASQELVPRLGPVGRVPILAFVSSTVTCRRSAARL
jgi:hypothetical protein